jgi:hypothetical protein
MCDAPIPAINIAAEMWLIPVTASSVGASWLTRSLIMVSRSWTRRLDVGDLDDDLGEHLTDVHAQLRCVQQRGQRGQDFGCGKGHPGCGRARHATAP